jgi:hypothetical protein
MLAAQNLSDGAISTIFQRAYAGLTSAVKGADIVGCTVVEFQGRVKRRTLPMREFRRFPLKSSHDLEIVAY